MKWFKHMSDAYNSQKIQHYLALFDRNPLEGYGFYWRLVEVVASQMDETGKCSVSYPEKMWSKMLGTHHHTWSKCIGKCEVAGLVTVKYMQGNCEVKIPKLLEIRDNHSKNLQAKNKSKKKNKNDDVIAREEEENNGSSAKPDMSEVRKIGDWCNKVLEPHLRLPLIDAPIIAWLQWGADFEMDIKPIILDWLNRKKGSGDSLSTLTYFDNQVSKSIEQRNKPKPTGGSNATNTTNDGSGKTGSTGGIHSGLSGEKDYRHNPTACPILN